MDDFENYAIEIDSELIGQDLDDIDPFGEDKFELTFLLLLVGLYEVSNVSIAVSLFVSLLLIFIFELLLFLYDSSLILNSNLFDDSIL